MLCLAKISGSLLSFWYSRRPTRDVLLYVVPIWYLSIIHTYINLHRQAILPFTLITTPIVFSTLWVIIFPFRSSAYINSNIGVSHNLQAISKSSWFSVSVCSTTVLVTEAISIVVMLCRGWDAYSVSRSWDVVHLGHNQPLLILLIQQGQFYTNMFDSILII